MQQLVARSAAVTAAQFREATGQMIADASLDAAAEAFLAAAVAVVETAAAHVMVQGEFRLDAGCPAGRRRWFFPVRPVVRVDDVTWLPEGGEAVTLDPADYELVSADHHPQLVLASGAVPSVAGRLQVDATLGHAPEGLGWPPQLTQAAILLAREWRDAGVAVETPPDVRLSFGAQRLIRQVRYRRLTDWKQT